jgi:hypothetical protein
MALDGAVLPVDLAVGERRLATFELGPDRLAQAAPCLETSVLPGTPEIRVALSSRQALTASPAMLRRRPPATRRSGLRPPAVSGRAAA